MAQWLAPTVFTLSQTDHALGVRVRAMLGVIAQPPRQLKQIEHPHLCATRPACAIILKAESKLTVRVFVFLSCTPRNSPESSKQ
jgi:hypothetical protein